MEIRSLLDRPPSYEEIATDLQAELRQVHAQLTEESRKRAMAEAKLAIVRKDRDRQIVKLEHQIRLLRVESVPKSCNDDDTECECAECYTPIEYPYEVRFCSNCGCKFDWKHYPDTSDIDDWEFDRMRDEKLLKAVGK